MEPEVLSFAVWWTATLAVLGIATSTALKSDLNINFQEVGFVFLTGVAAGLAMYLAPAGISSVDSLQGLQLRFLAALGISWFVAIRTLPAGSGAVGCSVPALAGFAGVNAPLLALVASSLMVCGLGQPSCAL